MWVDVKVGGKASSGNAYLSSNRDYRLGRSNVSPRSPFVLSWISRNNDPEHNSIATTTLTPGSSQCNKTS